MKVAGIGAIISAFFLLFLTLTGNKKAEINCLAELCTGFALIRAELGTRLTPMPELLSLLTERGGGETPELPGAKGAGDGKESGSGIGKI